MKTRKQEGFNGQKLIVLPKEVILQLENDPLINELFVTDIGFYPDAKAHFRERPSGSAQHILIYCTKGKGWIKYPDQLFVVNEQQFIIIPKDLPHQYGADTRNPWSIYWIHFKGGKASQIANALEGPQDIPAYRPSRAEERISLFDEIFLNLEMGYSKENLHYVNMVLWHFLGSLLYIRPFRQIGRVLEQDPIGESIRYMKENLDQSFSLSHLAGHCGYSPSHYIALFRKKTAYTPVEYFIHLKMQRACQYLDLTGLRVNEIANQLGYTDPYYFTRAFIKRIGMSPRKYRSKEKG